LSGTVADRKRLIRITAGNLRNNTINIGRQYGFFPSDCLGASRKSANWQTKPIQILLEGLNTTVETDIGTEAANGKPRRMFRGRKWVREFFEHHQIKPGDVLAVEWDAAACDTLRANITDRVAQCVVEFETARPSYDW